MRMSDWSSDVCSSDLCRSATVRFICRQAIARCRTLRQPTGSRSKSANSSRQPETRGTLLMAHEALLAALDQRRESARRMGGEAKLAKRRERGQLNAGERLAARVAQGRYMEGGVHGAWAGLGGRGRASGGAK